MLLGIALYHSRAIPRILAVLLAIAQPLHFAAFVVLQNTYLDVAAAWLTAVGFGAAGLSLLPVLIEGYCALAANRPISPPSL